MAVSAVKKAPAEGAYTKEQRQADTMEMIHAINLRAERRRVEDALYEWNVERMREKRRVRRWNIAFLVTGAAALIAAYGAMWWHGEQILAAYRG